MFSMREMRRVPGDAAYSVMPSPVGPLTLLASGSGLHGILWRACHEQCASAIRTLRKDASQPVIARTITELEQYFEGKRKRFTVPVDARGTDFQKRVWEQLSAIPYGETRAYGQLAAALGDPAKARAVGAANGNNPISIVVPCHRVIGKSGKLVGFAGGIEAKRTLLRLEGSDHV